MKSVDTPVSFPDCDGRDGAEGKGAALGAEDYIAKPFEIAELLARVETVLRRCKKTDRQLRFLNIDIDTDSRTVLQDGHPVDLTTKEYELLLLFLRNKNRALYRETIYENVWGGEYSGTGRTVDLHVQRLKKKLGLEEHIVAIYKSDTGWCAEYSPFTCSMAWGTADVGQNRYPGRRILYVTKYIDYCD